MNVGVYGSCQNLRREEQSRGKERKEKKEEEDGYEHSILPKSPHIFGYLHLPVRTAGTMLTAHN